MQSIQSISCFFFFKLLMRRVSANLQSQTAPFCSVIMITAPNVGLLQSFVFFVRMSLVQFPWSACQRVLGRDTEPQKCSWCAGRHHALQPPPSVYECVNYCESLWTRVSSQRPERNVNNDFKRKDYSILHGVMHTQVRVKLQTKSRFSSNSLLPSPMIHIVYIIMM